MCKVSYQLSEIIDLEGTDDPIVEEIIEEEAISSTIIIIITAVVVVVILAAIILSHLDYSKWNFMIWGEADHEAFCKEPTELKIQNCKMLQKTHDIH